MNDSQDIAIDALCNTGKLDVRFRNVRAMTDRIREPLTAEDCSIQSMPDVSPTRWHLAHTTWFFEQFILRNRNGYKIFNDDFCFLFNSYYNHVGKQFPRVRRGVISRPGLNEVLEYRAHVDQSMQSLLDQDELDEEQIDVFEIGLNHEQQHQELMLTDIKHVLSCNPLMPTYQSGRLLNGGQHGSTDWVSFDEGIYEIGSGGNGFAYDNEQPLHRVFVEPFSLNSHLVTCGEYLEFIEDGGYQRPDHWLSMGWTMVQENAWAAPLYWIKQGSEWAQFTLGGLLPVDRQQPVCHVSYFEADAFARWAGYRLPTEAEWEIAARQQPVTGNFVDRIFAHDRLVHPSCGVEDTGPIHKIYGDVWEWTSSQYTAYPGYRPPVGAIGEYNGKFMCNQFVLRGGSCASSADHLRPTYRNFFPPEARWQFSGMRLAK